MAVLKNWVGGAIEATICFPRRRQDVVSSKPVNVCNVRLLPINLGLLVPGNCVILCFTDPVCLGVSYDAFFVCSFNNENAMATNSFMPSPGSTSIFWTADVAKSTFSNASGGGVYASIDDALGWAEARTRCEYMPGFQLAELTVGPQAEEAARLAIVYGDQWIGLKTDGVNPYFVNSQVPWKKSILFTYPYKLNGDATKLDKPCYFLKKEEVDQDTCDKQLKYLCQSKYQV